MNVGSGNDLADPVNQFTATVALVIGIGDLTFTGIALGTIAAVVIYHGMRALANARA